MEFSTLTVNMLAKWAAAVVFCGVLCFGATPQPATAKKSSSKSKSSKTSSTQKVHSKAHKGKHTKKASWRRGQQKMDEERARQVQEALIREHYLTGEPTGVWDKRSQDAMVRFQAENGWQTKVVPDSRALIKLGLGPSNDHLLNPESAMTSPLQPASVTEHGVPAGRVQPASSATPNPSAPVGTPEPVSDPQR